MKKNIVIGILIAIILIMGGALIYFNVRVDKAKSNSNCAVTSNVKENSSQSISEVTKEEQTTEERQNSDYINAVYWNGDGGEKSEVVLFNDGKCLFLTVDSEYNLGTYKIENGKLIVTLEVYDETQTITYNISSDHGIITSENGLSLKKLS